MPSTNRAKSPIPAKPLAQGKRFAGVGIRTLTRLRAFLAVLVFATAANAMAIQSCASDISASFTGWSTNADAVFDPSTGLTWKRCSYGQIWNGSTCDGVAVELNWQDAVANTPPGWRLPNIKELESIVERQCKGPAVSTAAFPSNANVLYRSSTPNWSIDFYTGGVVPDDPSGAIPHALRYVRSGTSDVASATTGSTGSGLCSTGSSSRVGEVTANRWLRHTDGSLVDATTSLRWQRCVQGQLWDLAMDGCVGTPEALDWTAALERARTSRSGGYSDWRLPNIKELETLVDSGCADPALNPEWFRGNRETFTWSASPSWAINFKDGAAIPQHVPSQPMAVRLVRGGSGSAAASAALPGVPGAVLMSPAADSFELGNDPLLLPTFSNQKLMLITHGWNASAASWPAELLQAVCTRLGLTVMNGTLTDDGQAGVAAFCDNADWKVVAYNWKRAAFVDISSGGTALAPWGALILAQRIGQRLGRQLAEYPIHYRMAHLIAHSAGANLIHEMAAGLKRDPAVATKIHSTFLDPFCGYPHQCQYGYYSDWAENFFDAHALTPLEGTETRLRLCDAANFDVSATYPFAFEPDSVRLDLRLLARHAWPYRCYVNSAYAPGNAPADPISCLRGNTGDLGFGESFIGSGATDVDAFFSARNSAHKKGSLRIQTAYNAFNVASGGACGDVMPNAVAQTTLSLTINPVSLVGNVIGVGIRTALSDCTAPIFEVPTAGPGGVIARLLTCAVPGPSPVSPGNIAKRGGSSAAGSSVTVLSTEPTPSWSVLASTVTRRVNTLQFSFEFTQPIDAVLTAFVNDTVVFRTTRAEQGSGVKSSGIVAIPTLNRGTHRVSFRLDSSSTQSAAADISGVQLSAIAVCDLDLDGDGAITAGRDGFLLLRHLLGFRGAALSEGLGIGDANAWQSISTAIDSAIQYDVLGRTPGAPTAVVDGIILMRLISGASDEYLTRAASLNGVASTGGLFSSGADIRAHVNRQCGTVF